MRKIISLIIPIYKVEEYIEECINSILVQITPEIEVILINDGTPDNSFEIVNNMLKLEPLEIRNCFILLEQENQGQSKARNFALSIATGDYIAFLDSDDILEKNYFSVLLERIYKFSPDIISFKSTRFKKNQEDAFLFKVGVNKEGLFPNSFNLLTEIFNQSAWFPWLNIYKHTLFKNKSFPVGVYYEDAALIPELFLQAKTIYFLKDSLYGYRINQASSLLNNSIKNIDKHIESFKFIINLYEERLLNQPLYSPNMISIVQGYITYLIKNVSFTEAVKEYRRIRLKSKKIDINLVDRRGNILFYKFGIIFLVFTKIVGKD